MKPLKPLLALTAALAWLLGSCQQPYVDKAARTSGAEVEPQLTTPSVSIDDAPPIPGIKPTAVTAATAQTLWWAARDFVLDLVSATDSISPTAPPSASVASGPLRLPRPNFAQVGGFSVTPGTGLSGYTPVYPVINDQTSYASTTVSDDVSPSNTASYGSGTVGTFSQVTQSYEEALDDYYNNAGTWFQVYNKAVHRLRKSATHLTIDYKSNSSLLVSGTVSFAFRSEWYKDLSDAYQSYYGIDELSSAWVISATMSIDDGKGGTQLVGGIILATMSANQPFSMGSGPVTNPMYSYYNIAVYNANKQLVYSGLDGNPDAPYQTAGETGW